MALSSTNRTVGPRRNLEAKTSHPKVLPVQPEVEPHAISERDVLHFHVVAADILTVLGVPGREPPSEADAVSLSDREQRAIEALEVARTGVPPVGHEDTRGHVPGIERKQLLEHALAEFRQVLSIALVPGYEAERAIYQQLEKLIERLRAEILQAILLEGKSGRDPLLDDPARRSDDEDEDGDEDDDEDDD